jgi:hypothetical protein
VFCVLGFLKLLLEFERWSFLGIWILGFGISETPAKRQIRNPKFQDPNNSQYQMIEKEGCANDQFEIWELEFPWDLCLVFGISKTQGMAG